MTNLITHGVRYGVLIFVLGMSSFYPAYGKFFDSSEPASTDVMESTAVPLSEQTYVASNNSVKQLFHVLGGVMHKPFIVSNEAAKKRLSGNFDLTQTMTLLNRLTEQTGLLWYDDGSAIYICDANEIQSRVIKLAHASFDRLIAYLHATGLYDERFPPRSTGNIGSFYISGPPVYVELVGAAAKYLDSTHSRPSGEGKVAIRVIKLKNTYVNDRTFTLRDSPVSIPGVATVLNQLLNNAQHHNGTPRNISGATISVNNDSRYARDESDVTQPDALLTQADAPQPIVNANRNSEQLDEDGRVNIVAYSDSNSLLVQGSERQVGFVQDLVTAIDIPKQQIQLSLWIIDVSKNDIDRLGILWQGGTTYSRTGFNFNTTSLNQQSSMHFMANVYALVEKGSAQVVSRPEILTQDNIPALFDNNTTFYSKLQGERALSLEKVTYGTMVSVIPRLGQHNQDIEMILNIQDGGLKVNSLGEEVRVEAIPMVNNTQISTAARVPLGNSLLVGGYSRQQDEQRNLGIPVLRDIPFLGKLFDYSYTSHTNMVRLFLIQPKLLANNEIWQGRYDANPVLGQSSLKDPVTLKSTVSMLRQYMN